MHHTYSWLVKVIVLTSVSIAFTANMATAQECQPTFTFRDENLHDEIGSSSSIAGDVNGDGFSDIITGARGYDIDTVQVGRVYVFSGLTGDTIHIFTGSEALGKFGHSNTGAGDVNNDGFVDLIIGSFRAASPDSANTGSAYIYSGKSGDLLYSFTGEAADDEFGFSVSRAGDVNNDGFDDIIVGAPLNDFAGNNAGRVYVFSGFDGETLHVFTGESARDQLGFSVSWAGDIDLDGYDDVVIGSWGYSVDGANVGRAYVYSGRTGEAIHVFTGSGAVGHNLGRSVSGAGDVDNDGFVDLIIGAPVNPVNNDFLGRANIYSGQTGDLIRTILGESQFDGFGEKVSAIGDVNGDKHADLLVSASSYDGYDGETFQEAGRVYVYSGKTGHLLHMVREKAGQPKIGLSISGESANGSGGILNLVIGARGKSFYYQISTECFGCCDLAGDADNGGSVEIGDATILVKYIFQSESFLVCCSEADSNGDGQIDINDAIIIVNYIFSYGQQPVCADASPLDCP